MTYERTCVFCNLSFVCGSRTARYCSAACENSSAIDRALWPMYAGGLRDQGWTVSEIPVTIKRRKGYTARSPKNDQGISHFYHVTIHCPIQSLGLQERAKAREALELHRQNNPIAVGQEVDKETFLENVYPDRISDDLISTWVACDICGEYTDQTHVQEHDGVKMCLTCRLKPIETEEEEVYPF